MMWIINYDDDDDEVDERVLNNCLLNAGLEHSRSMQPHF